jgi:hypothetical protein
MTKPSRSAVLPEDLHRVRTLLDTWRTTATPYARLPESLWESITELLTSHSLAVVSRALDLAPERIRRRRKVLARRGRPGPQSAVQFLELAPRAVPTHASRTSAEISLVLERPDGLRITLALAAHEWARVEALVAALVAHQAQ